MTEQQLNQKAEEYSDEHCCDLSYDSDIDDRSECLQKAYKAGFLASQSEWRYVERDGLPTFTGTYQVSFEVEGLLGSNGTDVDEADFNYKLTEWLNWPEEFKIYAWRFIKAAPPLPPAKNQG